MGLYITFKLLKFPKFQIDIYNFQYGMHLLLLIKILK